LDEVMLGLAEGVALAAAFVGLAALTWRVLRWAAGLVSRSRQDALARAALLVALAGTVGACERSSIPWGFGYVPVALPILGLFFFCTMSFGLVQRWSRGGQLAIYLLMVLFLTSLEATDIVRTRASDEARSSTRANNLHQLGQAVEQYRLSEGTYPPSLGVLIDSGFLDEKALRQADQRTWVVYWPPRDDAPPDATLAFYWPPVHLGPDEVRTEVLFRDGSVETVPIQGDGSLMNPRIGHVIMAGVPVVP